MKKVSYILLTSLLSIFAAFWCYEVLGALDAHWHGFLRWCQNTHQSYYPWFLWVIIGGCVFPLVNKRWKNSEMIKTLLHERAHMLVSLMTFEQVDSLYASSNEGGVVWSRHGVDSKVPPYLSSLAPYCFPYVTIVLMMLRCLCNTSMLPVMDILLGVSLGLHFTCFREQTGNHQIDISSFPLWFSYTYIVHFWLFHAALLLHCLKPDANIFLAFRVFCMDFFDVLVMIFNMMF